MKDGRLKDAAESSTKRGQSRKPRSSKTSGVASSVSSRSVPTQASALSTSSTGANSEDKDGDKVIDKDTVARIELEARKFALMCELYLPEEDPFSIACPDRPMKASERYATKPPRIEGLVYELYQAVPEQFHDMMLHTGTFGDKVIFVHSSYHDSLIH